MPFYRKLAKSRDEASPKVSLFVVSLDPAEEVAALLKTERIKADGVYRASGIKGLSATPTLLFVNSSGVVVHVEAGELDPDQEQIAFRAISIAGGHKG
jgi:hypothetical protein